MHSLIGDKLMEFYNQHASNIRPPDDTHLFGRRFAEHVTNATPKPNHNRGGWEVTAHPWAFAGFVSSVDHASLSLRAAPPTQETFTPDSVWFGGPNQLEGTETSSITIEAIGTKLVRWTPDNAFIGLWPDLNIINNAYHRLLALLTTHELIEAYTYIEQQLNQLSNTPPHLANHIHVKGIFTADVRYAELLPIPEDNGLFHNTLVRLFTDKLQEIEVALRLADK